ncbi:MAG TPA: PIN domain-containing protein [Candidatus Thermoplasmatota archaeon]
MRVFLDASVLISAVERPESNSATVFRHVLAGAVEAVVDEVVLVEVSGYLREHRGRSFAWLYTEQVRRVATVLAADQCAGEFEAVEGALKTADRLHLAATRASKARYLVAFDDDFTPYDEYLTPRQAVQKLGLPPAPTEW